MEKNITTLSHKKKAIFTSITTVLPILIIIIFEFCLHIFNYGGNQELFISMEGDFSKYKRCNPNVAKRYFYMQYTYPTPPKDIFLKEKPINGYRIFVLGGSTAAGFPYGNNLTFSRILEKRLGDSFPEKHIELINTAMSAVNSYTMLDFIDEILEEKPDALLVYAGHNEFYGALGVASMESFGKIPFITRTYLKLTKFKIFLLLRDILENIRKFIGNIFTDDDIKDESNTLMARIIGDKEIPYKSKLYNLGKKQFEENLELIFKKIKKENVDIIIGELVSNIKDIEPFVSISTDSFPEVINIYKEAVKLEDEGKIQEAKEKYYNAKDLDALRFRATEEFNNVIDNVSEKYNVPVVRLKKYFENESENKLIGNNLMIDHLHPNIDGYFLMADAFYNGMMENNFISDNWSNKNDSKYYRKNWGYTELDSVYGVLIIKQLKAGWPFKKEGTINIFLQSYVPNNEIEKIALNYIKNPDYGLEVAHQDMAKHYKKLGDLENAFMEYQALYYTVPDETMFYTEAAKVLLHMTEYDKALQVLLMSLKYKDSFFANKWCGQIYLRNKDYHKAIKFMEKAHNQGKNDSQLLFNLSRAYLFSNNIKAAQMYYKKLERISPGSEYTKYLSRHLKNVQE